MFSSGKLMARKIDSEYDRNIIPEIKKRIGMTEKRGETACRSSVLSV
jgi:hypothetical protein